MTDLVERVVNVAYEGKTESFTYLAAKELLNNRDNVEFTGCSSMKEVLKQMDRNEATYGVLALESSLHGSIHGVYDALLNYDANVAIVAELGKGEDHCFCVPESGDLYLCSEVYGHPVTLESCSEFLVELDLNRAAKGLPSLRRAFTSDSVDACIAARAASSRERGVYAAAIASKEAALSYNLVVGARGVGNDKNAEVGCIQFCLSVMEILSIITSLMPTITLMLTRYVVIARASGRVLNDPLHFAPEPPTLMAAPFRGALKASLAVGLRNIPGALFKMTSCFAFRDMNIVKIESRSSSVANFSPAISSTCPRHWDLIYYVDYEPSDLPAVNVALLSNLREHCLWVRELGYYYAGLHRAETAPAEWKSMLEVVGY